MTVKEQDNAIIAKAIEILKGRLMEPGETLNSPETIETYLTLKYAELKIETFSMTFLDRKLRMVAHVHMFNGSTSHVTVYPREIIRQALRHNASFAIMSHNHPSGDSTVSSDDRVLTMKIHKALAMIDVKLLDHFIVAGAGVVSLAAKGLF